MACDSCCSVCIHLALRSRLCQTFLEEGYISQNSCFSEAGLLSGYQGKPCSTTSKLNRRSAQQPSRLSSARAASRITCQSSAEHGVPDHRQHSISSLQKGCWSSTQFFPIEQGKVSWPSGVLTLSFIAL